MSKDLTLYDVGDASRLLAAVHMYRDYYEADSQTEQEKREVGLLVSRCELVVAELQKQEMTGTLPESDSYRKDLRDHFAAQAIIRIRNDFPTKGDDYARQAKAAYEIADAMMAERDKENHETQR